MHTACLTTHQCVALIVVLQERLPESLIYVRVARVALEVKDTKLVERILLGEIFKLIFLFVDGQTAAGCVRGRDAYLGPALHSLSFK